MEAQIHLGGSVSFSPSDHCLVLKVRFLMKNTASTPCENLTLTNLFYLKIFIYQLRIIVSIDLPRILSDCLSGERKTRITKQEVGF